MIKADGGEAGGEKQEDADESSGRIHALFHWISALK